MAFSPPSLFTSSLVPKSGSNNHHNRFLGGGSGLAVNRGMGGRVIRVLANPDVSPSPERSKKKEVVMVDPVEAKRLAAKQMTEIRAKEAYKRKRKVEAINGAWAMIGLTAGLVIEGETGKSILGQLAAYWAALTSFFAF